VPLDTLDVPPVTCFGGGIVRRKEEGEEGRGEIEGDKGEKEKGKGKESGSCSEREESVRGSGRIRKDREDGKKWDEPVNTLSSFILSKFQIFTTPSSPPVTNLSSFGAQLQSLTASLWPWKTWRLFMLGWKYLMRPEESAERSHWPEWDQERARTAESWACVRRKVSKEEERRGAKDMLEGSSQS
jgi:hypothetical protein